MNKALISNEKNWFRKLDSHFLAIILSLYFIGSLVLYSATSDPNSGSSPLFVQQMIWGAIAWVVFFIITFMDYQIFRNLAYWIYGLNVLALLAVPLFGTSVLGAKRWLDFGFFRLQPSETMKLSLVLVLSHYLSQKNYSKGMGWTDLIPPILLAFVPFALTVQQPDLGTSTLIMFVALSLFFFLKIKTSVLLFSLFVGLVATPIVWNFGLKGYQRSRILTFVSPSKDPRGAGYNSMQSKIAVGSGLITGKGFLKGTQSQLDFIPERHSDFIYSVLSEESGFVGSVITLSLFMFLVITMLNIAKSAPDKFAALTVVGVASILFWHIIINIGMVTGLLPVVGLPLPLLSKGGSALVTTFSGLGIVSAIARRRYMLQE